jgi:hypothetical protein
MAKRTAVARINADADRMAAERAAAEAAPTELDLKRAEMARAEAQRGANELQAVLIQIAELLGATKGLRAWTVYATEVALIHRRELCWGLGADTRVGISSMSERNGGYAVRAEVNLASNVGSPGEVLARLAFHRDTAEKAAQAEMMLTNWLGRRPQFAVEAIFATLGDLLTATEKD